MQPQAPGIDHGFGGSPDKSAVERPPIRPADWRLVEECLLLLARAVQQLHTYPSTSPLCISAVEACQRAIALLETRDGLTLRVRPSEILVDDVPIGGSQIGHELARRLHKASVAAVTIERAATSREIGRFCEDLLYCSEPQAAATLLDRITEHGIDRVAIEMASRPEVFEVGPVSDVTAGEAWREHARFESQLAKGGCVNYLYPPQKGWVRLDPSSAQPSVSLQDLAVLADSPERLAAMLMRLTDEAVEVSPAEALEKKYSDVAMLIAALDPRVARRMFARLARAVLDLEPDRRQALLRRTVLPGLLDGRVDGAILRDFPDLDLAESLCLLLDLETAAPELLSTALSRLELSAEREAAMVPLLDAALKDRSASAGTDRQNTLARHARELMRIEARADKQFAEFAAFDLSMDEAAAATLHEIRLAVPATDMTASQLACLWQLICLEPNPETVHRFLERSFGLLGQLERASRGPEVPAWLSAYRDLADRLRESRPDVAAVIAGHLGAFCTPERAAWLADLTLSGAEGRRAAGAVVAALGAAVVPPLVQALESAPEVHQTQRAAAQTRARGIAQLLTDSAASLAPAVAPWLEQTSMATRRVLVRVLAAAGAGYEAAIAEQISKGDEQTAREALRALARIGTTKAAGLVVAEIVRQRGTLSVAAEETLWHFPAAEARRQTRELLGRREFTIAHPAATERLLDRVARHGVADFEPVLLDLAPLRFRLWNPAVARAARKAHGLLKPADRTSLP